VPTGTPFFVPVNNSSGHRERSACLWHGFGKSQGMRPALWKAVADHLKTHEQPYRLTAKDDFNARVALKGSTALVRAFYQPREGDVPGEATISLTLDGQSEIGAIAAFLSNQKRYAKKLPATLHFSQELSNRRPGGLGEARLTFKANVVSWHDAKLIERLSLFYADNAHALFQLHRELMTAGE
jgi:hypothetical protein